MNTSVVRLPLVTGFLVFFAATSLALAQEAEQGDHGSSTMEEITVTATKRASTIQDLPFSINAMSEEDIRRTGAQNIEELSRYVAGLTIQNLGPGQSQVAIRGVSAGQIVRDQPGVKEQVGVYLDESVISLSLFTPDLDLFDLNRVETLRGPQGTLFGSGSVGGTIRYITNQPDPEAFEAVVEVGLDSVTDGDMGYQAKAMLNQPLSETAALRVVGYYTDYAGFIDALRPNGQVWSDVNSGDRTGGRISLRWEATENLTITPRIVYQEIDMDGFNRQEVYNLFANPYTTTWPAVQLGERQQYLLLREGFGDETTIADLTVEGAYDGFDMTLIGSLTERDIVVSRDASALTGSVSNDVGMPDSDILLPSNLIDTTDVEQSTIELRFASNYDSALQWVGGIFWSDTERVYAQRLPTPGYSEATDAVFGEGFYEATINGFGPDSPYNSDLPYDLEQWALFGEFNYDVTDRLQLTAGGRWYDYEEVRSITQGGWFSSGYTNIVDETSSDGFIPRFMASYDFSDNVTFNAQASQGFRLGGVNDPLNLSLCTDEDEQIFGGFQDYDDETMWNYEAGLKMRTDGGIVFNAAIFHTDIEDLQVTLDAGSCSSRISFNVPEAHTTGVEFELFAQPVDGLELSFAGTVLEAEFDTTVIDANGNVLGGVQDGNRLASVPETQLAATAAYYWPVDWFGGGETYVSGSLQYIDDRITQPSDQVVGAGSFGHGLTFGGATGDEVTSVDLVLDSYETLNLRTGYIKDNWELTLYMNNVTDENAFLSFNRERGGRARLAYHVTTPRTTGLLYRVRF
ncbi:MAG: TonB-dependent receptor [Lysobacterales bacterium]|nr:MAG: TonB-dependent receptor [Xanthomonadales bacterium]